MEIEAKEKPKQNEDWWKWLQNKLNEQDNVGYRKERKQRRRRKKDGTGDRQPEKTRQAHELQIAAEATTEAERLRQKCRDKTACRLTEAACRESEPERIVYDMGR